MDIKKSTFTKVDIILTFIFIPIIISALFYFLILNPKTISYFISYHNNHQLEPIFYIDKEKIDDFYEEQTYLSLPGTYDGCFCYKGNNDTVVTIQSKCGQLEKVCKEVKAKTSLQIEKWKKTRLFYRRGNKDIRTNYWDYYNSSVRAGQTCSELGENYKPCGILDSMNNTLCMPQGQDCPINDIKIKDESIPEDGYEVFQLENGQYLHYSRTKVENRIFLELVVNQDVPCYNYKKETNNKILNYSLFIDPDDILCESLIDGKGTNNEWQEIDSEQGETLLDDNDMLHYFKTDLVDFPQEAYKTPFYLYNRNYIGVAKDAKCISYYEDNKGLFNHTKVERLNENYEQVKVNVLFAIIFLAMGFFSIIFRFTNSIRCNLTFHISTIILLSLGTFLIVMTVFMLTLTLDIEIDCADSITKEFAQKLISNGRIYKIGSFVVCGLSVVMTLIEIIGLLLYLRYGNKKGMGASVVIK